MTFNILSLFTLTHSTLNEKKSLRSCIEINANGDAVEESHSAAGTYQEPQLSPPTDPSPVDKSGAV